MTVEFQNKIKTATEIASVVVSGLMLSFQVADIFRKKTDLPHVE